MQSVRDGATHHHAPPATWPAAGGRCVSCPFRVFGWTSAVFTTVDVAACLSRKRAPDRPTTFQRQKQRSSSSKQVAPEPGRCDRPAVQCWEEGRRERRDGMSIDLTAMPSSAGARSTGSLSYTCKPHLLVILPYLPHTHTTALEPGLITHTSLRRLAAFIYCPPCTNRRLKLDPQPRPSSAAARARNREAPPPCGGIGTTP